MGTKNFSNKYGSLKVVFVGERQEVSKIKSAEFPEDVFFDMETAEKIALITNNRRMQISFRKIDKGNHGYLLYHFLASEVSLCRIESLTFSSDVIPSEEILSCKMSISL